MKLTLMIVAVALSGAFLDGSTAFKILGVFPTMAKSHLIVGDALMKGLAKAGHDVTVLSAFPSTKKIANYTHIEASGIQKVMSSKLTNLLDMHSQSVIKSITEIYEMGITITNYTLNHPATMKLLASGEKFDLIIVECFISEALFGIGQHFNAPVIALSTFGASKWTTDLVGSPSPLSYVPHSFLSFTDKMTFTQRFGNTMMSIFENIYMEIFYYPKQKQIYETHFPNANMSFDKMTRSVNFVLLNSHFSINAPRPYVPNMVEVGGMHINRVPNPLPTDIKSILDNAKHGVIYFSMGSNIQSTTLPVAKRDALIKTFASLKQQVIWKWESDDLPGKSDNVFIQKWLPQDDILAHPNVKLFITHGGLLGTTEAIFHGVPVIGIPIFGDQELNMARATRAEYGLTISYQDLNQDTLTVAIKQMLSDPKYSKNAKIISKRYRDQPKLPLDTAIYWAEYVARHQGAPHMHSAGQDLNFFQYHALDVFAVIVLFDLIIIALFVYLCKKVCCGSKAPVKASRKKKSN